MRSYLLLHGMHRFSISNLLLFSKVTILMNVGSKLLIIELPSILDGSAKTKAIPQDESKATLAPKVKLLFCAPVIAI